MGDIFTKSEIISINGCYFLKDLSFINNEVVTLDIIMRSKISIENKKWFLFNRTNINDEQRRELSLMSAWLVLPIFEKKYPNNNIVRRCLEVIDLFKSGGSSKEDILLLRYDILGIPNGVFNIDYFNVVYAVHDVAYYYYYGIDNKGFNDDYAAQAASKHKNYSKKLENLFIKFSKENRLNIVV